MRSATAARLLLGGACLAAPDRLLVLVGDLQADRRTRRVTQVLGARLVLQAGLDLALGPRLRGLDVAVELTHAASMLPAAVIWPAHRRSALVSAGLASGTALLDLAGHAGPSSTSSSPTRRRR